MPSEERESCKIPQFVRRRGVKRTDQRPHHPQT
jgi:hypothetical protein